MLLALLPADWDRMLVDPYGRARAAAVVVLGPDPGRPDVSHPNPIVSSAKAPGKTSPPSVIGALESFKPVEGMRVSCNETGRWRRWRPRKGREAIVKDDERYTNASATKQGTLVRGADGDLYFIRDEILEACKVTEADMKEFLESLVAKSSPAKPGVAPEGVGAEGVGKRFAFSIGEISDSVALRGPFNDVLTETGIPDLGQVASTVMCPGTMGLADFEIINPVG